MKGDRRPTDVSRERASTISEDSDATPHHKNKTLNGKGVDAKMARFRNSKLTLLLANALNGNSKTSVICTLSPAQQNADESLTTLNFATSLKHVKVQARAATFVDKDALISGLQREVQGLRERLSSEAAPGLEELKSELEVANGMLEKYRESWQEKIEENEKLREQRNNALRKLGVARFRMAVRSLSPGDIAEPSSRQSSKSPHMRSENMRLEWPDDCPHLASYSDDPQINGRFCFALSEIGFEYLGCCSDLWYRFSWSWKFIPRVCFNFNSGTAWAPHPPVISSCHRGRASPLDAALYGWMRLGQKAVEFYVFVSAEAP